MPFLFLVHAIPNDSELPSAVHYTSGKQKNIWKKAFISLYKEKFGLKRSDYKVKEICSCYKRKNAEMQAMAFAAENDCLYFLKKYREPGVWVKAAQVKKEEEPFDYYSLCSSLKFEPIFLPFCNKLVELKQVDAIPVFARFLVDNRIPTPPVKKRREAFKTLFSVPANGKCGFRECASFYTHLNAITIDRGPHITTWNGSVLPAYNEEITKEVEKREDVRYSIDRHYDIWTKKRFLDQICAEMNKMYQEQ